MSVIAWIKVMTASFLTSFRSYFHDLYLSIVTSAAPPHPQPVTPPDIESGGDALPTDGQQVNGLSIRDPALALSICSAVYPSIPSTEQLVSHPLRYSPVLAAVCLAVFSASLSLVRRSTRWIEVAVISSVFAYMLRILLLLPGESLVAVAVLVSFGIGLGAIYVWFNSSQKHRPNVAPETNIV